MLVDRPTIAWVVRTGKGLERKKVKKSGRTGGKKRNTFFEGGSK